MRDQNQITVLNAELTSRKQAVGIGQVESKDHPIPAGPLAVGPHGRIWIIAQDQNTARVGKSPVSDEDACRLAEPGASFRDVQELVAGTAGRELLETGDLSKGVFWAGMVQGLIHDIPNCEELIGRIVGDAEAIVRGRLGGFCQRDMAG